MNSATLDSTIEKKICTACGETKQLQEFHRFGKNRERVGKWCEPCFQRNNGRRKDRAR